MGPLVLGCDERPEDLREWMPDDHDNRGDRPIGRRAAEDDGHQRPSDQSALVEVTWQQQCANCHGPQGRGDGPMSAMVQAKDLSDPAWQTAASDAQIIDAITKGKGRMPPLNLPANTVQALVQVVRKFARPGVPGAAAVGGATGVAPVSGQLPAAPVAPTAATTPHPVVPQPPPAAPGPAGTAGAPSPRPR